jgi:hypothetical protein
MTPVRWLIVLFWVFVIFMLLKGCYDTEASRAHQEELRQAPPPVSAAPAPPPAPTAPAKVVQTSCMIEVDTPPGSFTCEVTVKNVGGEKATGVEVHVRPFRGSRRGLVDIGPMGPPLNENDPLSLMGTWIAFPDLAPGESSTQTATFPSQPNIMPSQNPDPDINYKSVPSP